MRIGWTRSRGRRASIPGSSGGRASTAAGVPLALSSTEGGWTTRGTAPPRAGLFAPPGRASKARLGSGTPTPASGIATAAARGAPHAQGPQERAGPQLGRLARVPTGRRPPPGTAGTAGEAPPEGLVCIVTCTGALATARGTRLLAERVLTTTGACRSMHPGPDAAGATARTVAEVTEELGHRRTVDALPVCSPDRAPPETGLRPTKDDDADGGDGGPDRGGGRVALVPGPGADSRRGVAAQEASGQGAEQPGPPPPIPAAGGSQEATEPGERAEEGAADTGAPPADPDQQGQGSWGWGWWGSSAWQGGSSHGGWWDWQRGDGDDGDAWAQWHRGGHGVQPGSHSGYGGGGRRRPKPAERAAAFGRPFTREEWIEELIADPPNPNHPEFRSPGAWERWVRGAFRAYMKIGDAKYRVKTKRANCDREVRGADPDYGTRGGRAAAMDPSIVFDQQEGHGGGQEREDQGGGGGCDGDAGATGGRPLPRPPISGHLRLTWGVLASAAGT